MTPTPDSPLAAAFVAAPDHWPRNGVPVKAIVGHMAEGAGTVSWLTRDDGNSSHYVVELSGRVVQMVPESLAAGSLNPGITRTTDDAPYTFEGESVRYGATALRAALGAAGVADPNRCVVAIEVEGFARSLSVWQRLRFPRANPAGGPNAVQRASLKALVNDIRRRRGALPVIGHRDQQDQKACPGHAFPWADFGGHGVKRGYVATPTPPTPSTGDTVKSFLVPEVRTLAKIKDLAWLYVDSSLAADPANIQLSPSRELVLVGMFSAAVSIVAYEPAASDADTTSRAMFVRTTEIVSTRPAPVPVTDCTAAVKAAVDPLNAALATAKADTQAAVAASVSAARIERERIAAAESARIRSI